MKTRRYYVTIRGAKKQFSSILTDSDTRVTLFIPTSDVQLALSRTRMRIGFAVSRQTFNVICVRSKLHATAPSSGAHDEMHVRRKRCVKWNEMKWNTRQNELCRRSSKSPDNCYAALEFVSLRRVPFYDRPHWRERYTHSVLKEWVFFFWSRTCGQIIRIRSDLTGFRIKAIRWGRKKCTFSFTTSRERTDVVKTRHKRAQ